MFGGIRVHTENLELALDRVEAFIETEVIPIMAKVTLSDTKRKMGLGEKPDGGSYEGYKSERYKRFRSNRGKQTGHVDFEVTGGLKESIKFFKDENLITVEDDYDEIAKGLTKGYEPNKLVARNFFADPGEDTIDKGVEEVLVEFNKLS